MARIAHLTDLHLNAYPANLDVAVEQLGSGEVELILIGGDNGGEDGLRATIDALSAAHPEAEIAWVMGNHDLWGRSYRDMWLPFEGFAATHLEAGNFEGERLTVVGTYGHYDYSGGDPTIPLEMYESFTDGRVIWNDRHIERHGCTNPEIATEVSERFAERYAAAVRRGLPIVVLSHTWPFAPSDPHRRSFVGAYLCNQMVGDAILHSERPPMVLFCGHTHRPIVRKDFGFPMINTGSDYREVRTTLYDL